MSESLSTADESNNEEPLPEKYDELYDGKCRNIPR